MDTTENKFTNTKRSGSDGSRGSDTNDTIITVRPRLFKDIIGRDKEKKSLSILIESAKMRGDSVDHILFYGPPGLGKTSLSYVIANEMGVNIKITSGPAIERTADLAAILTSLNKQDVLFIDEIHRLPKIVEEMLYPAMEDFAFDIILGAGPSARTMRLELERFTIIGATTRLGLLSSPLRDRFGVTFRLDFYNDIEIGKILKRSSDILNISISDDAISEIASRSRGTARVANKLLRRVRDYSQVYKIKKIDSSTVLKAMSAHDIDKLGLDSLDIKLLKVVIEKFNGGPVGINTIAAALSEEISTVSDVCEPYLIQSGFLKRTSRGRIATKLAYDYLNLDYNEQLSFL